MNVEDLVFRKVDFSAAVEIARWEYPAPYHVYNLHGSGLAIGRLVDGPYLSVYSGDDLMGFFCYGPAAQLKVKHEHGLYLPQEYLDVGLGMHPAWCGQGYGMDFVRSGLCFARHQDWRDGFRLTVASNNTRAFAVYSKLGFGEIGRLAWDTRFGSDFVVMTLDTFEPTPEEAEAR